MENRHKQWKRIVIPALALTSFCLLGLLSLLFGAKNSEIEVDLFAEPTLQQIQAYAIGTVSTETTVVTSLTSSHLTMLYITGEVNRPGLVEAKEGMYLYEAIELAGGFTALAATESINLAARITPESHIRILSVEEWEASGTQTFSDTAGDNSPTVLRVNLNTASQAEFESLPGIGPAMARTIVSYREENGPFTVVEDIQNVSGIKEAKFSQLKDFIYVG